MTQTVTNNSAPPIRPKAKLARQTRRIVNVRLLVLSLLILVVAGVLGYFWHEYQSQRVAGMLLDRAESLEREEKWAEASNYLTRYLQVEPADTAARLRLVDAVERSSAAGPGKRRLGSLLYQTLGTSPEREDLRLKLAQTLLDLRDFSNAQKQAEILFQSKNQPTLVAARRIAALSLAAKAEPGGLTSIATAAQALEAALKDNPGDVTVASLTAAFYRQYANEVGVQATPANADRVMDELVNADKQNIDALIARHKYRVQYEPSQARADLDAALALNPDHIEALVLDTQSGLASGEQARVLAAQKSAQHLIEISPQEPRGYISLAQLESRQGHTDRAVELLGSGRKKLAAENLDFDYLYAGLLLDLGKTAEARAIATDFSKQVDRWLPELPRASRSKLENMNRLIQARLAIGNGDSEKAARELNKIVASVGDSRNINEAFEALIAHDLLAVLATQQQRPDLAASHWSAIAELQPGFRQAALKGGMANLELGRVNEALAQVQTYLQLPDASPEANLTLVQARLQEQLVRPVAERSWTDFLTAVEQAKTKLPNRWEWQLAEIVYLQSQPEQESKQRISDVLAKLETTFPTDATLCERLLVFYQQAGRPKDAERMLKRYGELQPDGTRGAILNATYLASNKQIPEAIKYLADAAAKAPTAEKRDLTLAQIKLMVATNQLSEAQELVSKTLIESPTDVQILTAGLEIALLRKQYDTALKLESALANASGADNFEFRFLRARRLVAQYGSIAPAERAELEHLVDTLRVDRPTWFPVLALTGQVAEAQGNRQAAIEAFRSALAAGDRRPETLEQLVRVLYADGQFDEATRYLSQVKSDESSTGRYESMAIIAAVKRNQLEEARGLAQHAVERGSKDPIHFIWLANLMKAAGDQQGAESTFRTALQQFPKDVRVWNGVFAHFLQSGQADRARKTLERWTEAVPMSEFEKSMVLGQGNESLGDQKAAQEFYRKAVNEQPENLTARFLLAKSIATTDSAAARRELDFVLQKDPSHPDARRMQATLLAATGDANDWSRAFDLLNQGEKDAAGTGSGDDNRLRAILLARKRTHCELRVGAKHPDRQLGEAHRSIKQHRSHAIGRDL
jgi:Tfp pilus assembly protein PilF